MPGWEGLYQLAWPESEEFTDLCDIYPLLRNAPASGSKFGGEPYYPVTPTYSAVPCAYKRTFDYQVLNPDAGQQTLNNYITQDYWTTHSKQPLESDWGIVMRTPGHPEYGHWWTVQGEPKANPDKVSWEHISETVAMAKEGTPPSNVTGLTG